MTELNAPEPSMEEILASIRRIISEDLASVDPAGAGLAGPLDHEEDVLILRERAPPEPTTIDPPDDKTTPRTEESLVNEKTAEAHATDQASAESGSAEPSPTETAPAEASSAEPAPSAVEAPPAAQPPVAEAASAEPSPPIEESPSEAPAAEHHPVSVVPARDQALVAPQVAMSAAASFERLYFVVETPPPPSPVAVSASGPTLEDLTRELLKPIVKAWLDENLDAIVRARVDEEVERISRGRVR